MYVDGDKRRWFEDLKYRGRFLAQYAQHLRQFDDGDTELVLGFMIVWKYGRPVGASRSRWFLLKSLERERYRGERRFRELEGEELERARTQGAR